MRNLRLLLILLGLLCIAVLVLQNQDAVETQLLVARVTLPLAVLLFVTFALGFLVGSLVTLRIRKPAPKGNAAPAKR